MLARETSTMVYTPLNGLAPDNLCQIFSRLSDVHNLRNTKCDLAISRMREQLMIKSHLRSVELIYGTNSLLM